MTRSPLTTVVRRIRDIIGLPARADLSDGQLLERFVDQQDESAFELLMQRYGSMVLGVCRRLLSNAADADDAFQATFLVLVRRAGTLDRRASLAGWLYGVAYRVALKTRTAAARRRERDREAMTMFPKELPDELAWREIRLVLDEELQLLPEKYRDPLVLCYLAGKTNEEAARALGCPPGSIWWRLDRARALLRARLTRRGVALPAGALTVFLTEQTPAAVASSLAARTLNSAVLFVTGQSATTAAQAHVFTLAEGALTTMMIHKWLRAAAALLLLIGLASVAGAASYYLLADAKSDKNLPPIVRSVQSGPWSASSTWEGGKAPGAQARVLIREGHRIVYDVQSDQPIRAINIAGTLSFATDKDTRLDVGLIKIQAGADYSEDGFDCDAHAGAPESNKPRPALEIGTPNQPIDAKHNALIRLTYIDGLDKQSCPAIVCCGGRMDIHGAPLSRAWVRLGADAKAKAGEITLAEGVTGWRVGDRIIVTATHKSKIEAGTRRPGGRNRDVFTEECIIKALDGTKLTLDQPLDFDHAGSGDFRGEVANLSRNVVIESANPAGERGHTMYHRYSAGAVSYAEFRHLGKENVLGRYALHFHMVGDTMRGSYVIGASIWDSRNRWLTIHGTNYLVVRDNVGYQSVGHGFFLEDGTEVYNVLDRNLAVQAFTGKKLPKQVLPFDQNEGSGFWWANSLNTFTNNVSCENDRYGYRYEATKTSSFNLTLPIQQPDGSRKPVDIRTLPFVRFDDNEAHTDGLYGFNLGEGVARVGPDTQHPFIVRRMKIWSIHYAFRPQVPSLLVEDMRIQGSTYGVYHPNYDHHVYRNLTINGSGSEPFNRGHDDDSVQYGPLTVDGLTFTAVQGYPTSIPLIQISDDNPTGKAVSHFRNVKVVRQDAKNRRPVVDTGGGAHVTPKTAHGVPVYLHDYFGPNRHAKVAATNARDYGADGNTYRDEVPLTGHEARVTEVSNVEFPKLLDPVDDLPPTTVITHVRREAGKVTVRGTTADNGTVKRVLVNGKEARSTSSNFAEWEIVLDAAAGELKIEAFAEDAAGNVEKRPHVVTVK